MSNVWIKWSSLLYGVEWQHSKKINGKSNMNPNGSGFEVLKLAIAIKSKNTFDKSLEISHRNKCIFSGLLLYYPIVFQSGLTLSIRRNWYGQQTNGRACIKINEWVGTSRVHSWHKKCQNLMQRKTGTLKDRRGSIQFVQEPTNVTVHGKTNKKVMTRARYFSTLNKRNFL